MQKLDLCKKCTQRVFEPSEGLVCSLTRKKPEFEHTCMHFSQDDTVADIHIEKTRPNLQRAKIAYILVGAVTVFDLFLGYSEYLQYKLLVAIQAGDLVTPQMASQNDFRHQVFAIINMIIYVFSIITFLQWFRRAYFNMHQRTNTCVYTEGWAVGAWFVPIICLFRPYQIMKEMWEYIVKRNKNLYSNFYESSIGKSIVVWWVLWIIVSYIGNFIIKSAFKAETVNEMINSSIASIISSFISLPMGILLIRIIKEYSNMEENIHRAEQTE